ncbi:MAG: hypothetical protein ACRBN8_21840 [Nannocystales bacterium]
MLLGFGELQRRWRRRLKSPEKSGEQHVRIGGSVVTIRGDAALTKQAEAAAGLGLSVRSRGRFEIENLCKQTAELQYVVAGIDYGRLWANLAVHAAEGGKRIILCCSVDTPTAM